MKIFFASIDHETNRFSPIPTSLESFREGFLYRPSNGEGSDKIAHVKARAMWVGVCKDRGHELEIGVVAATHPSAPTTKMTYELLREELLASLRAAGPIDCVMLRLHGAMVAEGYDDCEGDILQRVRREVGANFPVGVIFDLHGNVTKSMVDNASVMIACKEYPHTDFDDRTVELLGLMENMVAGICQPTTAHVRVPLVGLFQTTQQPMRSLVDEIISAEGVGTVLSVSLTHGFLWSDVADVGSGVLVVSNNDPARASELAGQLAKKFFSLREEIKAPVTSLDDALSRLNAHTTKPLIIADRADNPGGGAAGDSTAILQVLLEQGVTNVAIGMIWDPMTVELASKAGLGAKIALRVGGKMGRLSGLPVDLNAHVIGVTKNLWQFAMGVRENLGPAVAIEAEGVQIILVSNRQQVLSPECFTELGISLSDKKLLVLKSAQHFSATFSAVASEILYVDVLGTVSFDLTLASYKSLPRPLCPLDKTPFQAFGRKWI